ncbi:MAG: hypothetical protein AAF662_04550 [Pseudomonadota bacterium]
MLTGIVGVWACVYAFAAFGVARLQALGVDFHEAEGTIYVIGSLLFMGLSLWTFATQHPKNMAAVLVSIMLLAVAAPVIAAVLTWRPGLRGRSSVPRRTRGSGYRYCGGFTKGVFCKKWSRARLELTSLPIAAGCVAQPANCQK